MERFLSGYKPAKTFSVAGDGFYGLYFEPKVNRFPGKGMVICTGSDGSFWLCRHGAYYFLEAGMPVLALGYFHVPGTPADPLECPVEYMQKACRWLKKEKGLHPGVWGISLGGEYVLLCGSLCPEIECVVAVSPVHVVTQCGSFNGGLHCCMGSPFSWKGKALPYAVGASTKEAERRVVRQMKRSFLKHKEMDMLFYYRKMLNGPYLKEAAISVEKISGPVLLISGAQDCMVPADRNCREVVRRIKSNEPDHLVIHKNYKYLSHFACPLPPVLLPALRLIFQAERKHKKECSISREKVWKDTLEFLRNEWKIGS